MTKARSIYKKILLAVSFLEVLSFWAFRYGWHFTLSGITMDLTIVFVFLAVNFMVAALLYPRESKKIFVVAVSVVAALGLLLNVYFMFARSGDLKVYARFFVKAFLTCLPVLCALRLTALAFSGKLGKKRIAAYLAVILLLSIGVACGTKPLPVWIVEGPVVYEYGEDYAVVWTTSSAGTGYLVLEGDEKNKIYHHLDGKRVANTKIHIVTLPKEKLNGSAYYVATQKLLFQSSNIVKYGNTVTSETVRFRDISTVKELSFLSISDIHSMPGASIKLAQNTEMDFLVLNGDIVSFLADAREAEHNILGAAHDMTNGEIPVVFSRGNHELMSYGTDYIRDYVRTPGDKFYYMFSYGDVFGVVLDAGQDKPDNHFSYGGLATADTYRAEQTQWLREVVQSHEFNAAKHRFVISHVPLSPTDSAAYSAIIEEWADILNAGDIAFNISGHTHKSVLNQPTEETTFAVIEDGGNLNHLGTNFVATRVTFKSSSVVVEFINEKSEVQGAYSMIM